MRKKKEKERTLKINENLTKKTKKRIEVKENEIKSLQKTVKRIRNERDDEAVHDAAMKNLQAELERLEKRFKTMEISVKKTTEDDAGFPSGSVFTDLGDATTNDDEAKPEKSKHMSATDSESSSLYNDEVQLKKRKSSESFVEESAGQPFKKKKSDILPKFNQEKEFLDDSFNNLIPVSNEVIGRNVVKNYECKKDVTTTKPTATNRAG